MSFNPASPIHHSVQPGRDLRGNACPFGLEGLDAASIYAFHLGP